MSKEELNELQEKISKLERIMMRDVDEKEIDYLKDNSVEDFLREVLGFDNEDLVVLMLLQTAISDWCTRPAEYYEDNNDLCHLGGPSFFDLLDEEELKNLDIFNDSPVQPYQKVVDVLQTIIDNLQNELKKYKKKEGVTEPRRLERKDSDYVLKEEGAPKVEITSDVEQGEGFDLDAGEEYDACDLICEPDLDDLRLPESIKKWTACLDEEALNDAIIEGINNVCPDKADKELTSFDYNDIDGIIGEVVDTIKDYAITHYVSILKKGEEIEFDDEEIQNEVLDYLYKNKYKVKVINNKVSLLKVDAIKENIDRLLKGETLELEPDILDQVVDRLWTEQNNIRIEVKNNKIRLR